MIAHFLTLATDFHVVADLAEWLHCHAHILRIGGVK